MVQSDGDNAMKQCVYFYFRFNLTEDTLLQYQWRCLFYSCSDRPLYSNFELGYCSTNKGW